MTSAQLAGTLLAADADARRLRYLLLPYGEQGRTNLGRVTAGPGVVTIPDRLVANLEHDPARPVAWADRADIRDTPAGLEATFTVAETTAGNDLLVEARGGLRAGVSVEVNPIVIRDGAIRSGTLNGAGFVVTPAFPSAGLVAADAGELEETAAELEGGADQLRTTADQLDDAAQTIDPTSSTDDDQEEEGTVPENNGGTATAPTGGLAARAAGATAARPGVSRSELVGLMASAHRAGGARGLMAALSDIVPADILGMEQPDYVGQLWDGRAYQRRFIPLFNHKELTSFNVRGWRWLTRPTVAAYAGNKTAVPSNAAQTEQVDITAERIAGAHDIDRKFRDFNDQEFFDAYFQAMTESYARVSDLSVAADVFAEAPVVEAGAVPAGVAAGLAYIVDGALAVLEATDTMPTFGIVDATLWRDIVLTPRDSVLGYLNAAFGLEEGSAGGFSILPAGSLPVTGALVGTREAATVHELGTTPIRVEAENIPQGGIDVGVFGYYATNIHDVDGLAAVTAPAGE